MGDWPVIAACVCLCGTVCMCTRVFACLCTVPVCSDVRFGGWCRGVSGLDTHLPHAFCSQAMAAYAKAQSIWPMDCRQECFAWVPGLKEKDFWCPHDRCWINGCEASQLAPIDSAKPHHGPLAGLTRCLGKSLRCLGS